MKELLSFIGKVLTLMLTIFVLIFGRACREGFELTAKQIPKTARQAIKAFKRPKISIKKLKIKKAKKLKKAKISVRHVPIVGDESTNKAIPPNSIKLNVYSSSGKIVARVSANANEILGKVHLKRQFQKRFSKIYDDVIDELMDKKIPSQEQLEKEISKAIAKRIKDKKYYKFNEETGNLTHKMSFDRVQTRIDGTINMVKTIKDALIIGGGGYLLFKEGCEKTDIDDEIPETSKDSISFQELIDKYELNEYNF